MLKEFKTFIDCGAPSLYNRLSRKSGNIGVMGASFKDRKYDDYSYTESKEYQIYRDTYIQYLLDNKGRYDHCSNLDVINNPVLTYKNQRILEEAGLNPIPVFHLGNDPKWLKRYIDRYEYVALGGLVPNTTSQLIPILDKLFSEYLIDSDGFPKVKLHGFACTSLPLMIRYPWYSVDSTTCRKLAMYGSVIIPNGKKKVSVIDVSTRDNAIEALFRPKEIEALEKRFSKTYALDFHEMQKSVMLRVIWNYLLFSEMIHCNVPAWPWSFSSRKTKGLEYLTYYLAGSFSKKEEYFFWETIEEFSFISKSLGRLQSFFYKNSVETILNIRNV